MSTRPDNWMPLYVRDYLADTMHLTRDQHGGYLLLIFAYWMRGGPLPDDDEALAAIVRAPAVEWRKRLRPVLAPFFHIADGQWQHKRIDAEMAGAETAYAERVERTRAAREARERKKPATGRVTTSVTENATKPATEDVATSAEGSVTKTQPQPQSLSNEREGERASAPLPPDWVLPDEWKAEAEKARERNGLPSVNLALAAERFAGHNEHTSRKNWRGAWLKWALDEHASKGANGHAGTVPHGEPDPAKEAARIAGMIATMVKTGKRLFPMLVSDRQLVAACRANTLPRELLEQWLGPGTAAEMLR